MAFSVDEERVEQDIKDLRKVLNRAWERDVPNLVALVERLRVQMIIDDMNREEKRLYRSLIDYYEDAVEQRRKKQEEDRGQVRHAVLAYIKRFVDAIDDEPTGKG